MKYILITILLVILSQSVLAQQHIHNKLLDLINSSLPVDSIQKKVTIFIEEIKLTTDNTTLADCYHDLGSKWYFKNWLSSYEDSQLANAILITKKSISLKRELIDLESCSLNKSLYNLGYFNLKNNNVFEAIELFKEIIDKGTLYCNKSSRENNIRLARNQLIEAYIITGNYYKAIDLCNEFLQIYAKHKTDEPTAKQRVIECYLQKAYIMSLLENKDNSDELFDILEKATSLLDKKDTFYTRLLNEINTVKANWQDEIGDYKKAIETYKVILKNLPKKEVLNTSAIHNNLGLSYLASQQQDSAKIHLMLALKFDSLNDAPYNNLGDLFLKQKNIKQALFNYQQAINLYLDEDNQKKVDDFIEVADIKSAPDKTVLLNHLICKANALTIYFKENKNKKHLRAALHLFEVADQLIDLIHFESQEYESKLFWRKKANLLYIHAVEASFLLNDIEKAYYFMERNKAILLLEGINDAELRKLNKLPVSILDLDFKYKQQIYLEELKLNQTDSKTAEWNTSKDKITALKKEYYRYTDSIYKVYPAYSTFKAKAEILSFEKLQKKYIEKRANVLHYIISDTMGFGLLSTKEKSQFFKLKDVSNLNKNIEHYIHLVKTNNQDESTLNKLSNTIFNTLFSKNTYELVSDKKVTIIPDNTLLNLPFEILITNQTTNDFFINNVESSYAYSMSVLEQNQKKERKATKTFLGFAPVEFKHLGLNKLGTSKSELKAISAIFEGALFMEDSATKVNFFKELNNYRVIHLATHAAVDDGANPWIAFSDEKMYQNEIYSAKNQSEMVVLSACNTSTGNMKKGEGVMSLARGFFFSGTNSVVSSLWPVGDKSSKELMVLFYQHLKKGDSKSSALRKAKLTYLNTVQEPELKHPYYWAGFIVIGNNDPLTNPFNWYWVLVIGLLSAAIILFKNKLLKLF